MQRFTKKTIETTWSVMMMAKGTLGHMYWEPMFARSFSVVLLSTLSGCLFPVTFSVFDSDTRCWEQVRDYRNDPRWRPIWLDDTCAGDDVTQTFFDSKMGACIKVHGSCFFDAPLPEELDTDVSSCEELSASRCPEG